MNDEPALPPSLSDPAVYNRSVRAWQTVWEESDKFVRDVGGWTSPWLDESWKDGNPIFSAWSPTTRRGIRIIQHDESGFVIWRNTFARGSADAVDEFVVSCALTDDTVERVRALLSSWMTDGGVVSAESHRRRPFELTSPRDDLASRMDENQAA